MQVDFRQTLVDDAARGVRVVAVGGTANDRRLPSNIDFQRGRAIAFNAESHFRVSRIRRSVGHARSRRAVVVRRRGANKQMGNAHEVGGEGDSCIRSALRGIH